MKREKMTPRQLRELVTLVFLCNAAVAVILSMLFDGSILIVFVAMIPTMLVALYAAVNCRCPRCGCRFDFRITVRFPEHCPKCGSKTE